jgi:acetoin utilization deacetylase AcuC-like enzyme
MGKERIMATTGVIWDARYTEHDMGMYHPESPKRLLAIKEVLDGDGVGKELVHLEPRDATKDEIAWIHDPSYIDFVASSEGSDGMPLDFETFANAHTWAAAKLAAGGAMNAADAVNEGKVNNAFAFIRPPGHHAERDTAKGFCVFNNVAIATEHLIRSKGIDLVAIIDFDVHHGNGTQHAFYNRDDVLYVSTHRGRFYPGSGTNEETGGGKGKGFTVNIPLSVGADDDDYKRAFDKIIIPAVRNFQPQIILLSAGFDAHRRDPMGGMRMTTDGYRWIGRTLGDLANDLCNGKIVYVLEGGYDLVALRDSCEAILEEMASS